MCCGGVSFLARHGLVLHHRGNNYLGLGHPHDCGLRPYGPGFSVAGDAIFRGEVAQGVERLHGSSGRRHRHDVRRDPRVHAVGRLEHAAAGASQCRTGSQLAGQRLAVEREHRCGYRARSAGPVPEIRAGGPQPGMAGDGRSEAVSARGQRHHQPVVAAGGTESGALRAILLSPAINSWKSCACSPSIAVFA